MIAITGAGIISALGTGKEATLQALNKGLSGIGPVSILPTRHRDLPVGEVKLTDKELKALLGMKDDAVVSRTALLAMIAVDETLKSAGIDKESPANFGKGSLAGIGKESSSDNAEAPKAGGKSSRMALISATTVGGMDITEQQWPEGGDDYIGQHFACCHTDAVNARLGGIFSNTLTVSTACSAAANAMVSGALMIERGEADMVVAGGSEALSLYHLNGFNSLMILDSEPCRPFDRDRHGLNLGEGAAYVCLETVEHAQARGARILAVLKGWGNRCDAYHQTATSPEGNGPYLAMSEALRKAGLSTSDIQYINAHGTGTENNDSSETEALKRLFGEQVPPFSSTKSFTGHATSASGSIEAVICLLALQHQFMPANLNFKAPFDGGLTPVIFDRKNADESSAGDTPKTTKIENILSNSFAFGGNDTALVLSAAPQMENGGRLRSNGEWRKDNGDAGKPAMDNGGSTVKTFEDVPPMSEIDVKSLISPMKLRRLDPLLKEVLVKSLYLLRQAGIDSPGAVFCNTISGCMGPTEKFLGEMLSQEEQALSPTAFMLSTHNTIATLVARETGCHGYNITFSNPGAETTARAEAQEMLNNGGIESALLISAEWLPEEWLRRMENGEWQIENGVKVELLVRTKQQ